MLKLVGLGLFDEQDISLRGLEEARNSDEVYIETYTNSWKGSIDNLEKLVGKKIKILGREEVESDFLISRAEKSVVTLLVPGDPLSATTHFELIIEAKKKGIETKVVHSSSIFTAVAETGLQLYKFGKTISVPKPRENFHPTKFYDEIKRNLENGLHTLLLFDIGFPFSDARKFLREIDRDGIFEKVVVCSRLGGRSKIFYGRMENVEVEEPFVMIIPGKLHFKEKEALELWTSKKG